MNPSTDTVNTSSGQQASSRGLLFPQSAEPKSRFTVTIRRSPEEVFAFWRKLSNLPLFMKDLSSVIEVSPKKSHWTVTLKSGVQTEWDAVITHEEPGQMIAWESVEDSDIHTQGTVWFLRAPANLGTEVTLMMNYEVPGGQLTEIATALVGESPDLLVQTNLRRLKAYLETGEIPTIDGQPSGREDESETITH